MILIIIRGKDVNMFMQTATENIWNLMKIGRMIKKKPELSWMNV